MGRFSRRAQLDKLTKEDHEAVVENLQEIFRLFPDGSVIEMKE